MEKGDRVDMLFQKLEREVVPGGCWCISESIYQVLPVFAIKSEV